MIEESNEIGCPGYTLYVCAFSGVATFFSGHNLLETILLVKY